jgi:hypothetical protein
MYLGFLVIKILLNNKIYVFFCSNKLDIYIIEKIN